MKTRGQYATTWAARLSGSVRSIFDWRVCPCSKRGIGVSWHAGISTIRKLSPRSGLETGVVYEGHWFGRFGDGTWGAMGVLDNDADEEITFTANRFKLYFMLLLGRRPPPLEATPEPVVPTPASESYEPQD